MTEQRISTEELVKKYKGEVEQLSRYIPWFEKTTADVAAGMYRGQGTGNGFAFPVYDSTLLSFINEFKQTSFLDVNYRYVYTRHFIRTHEDEWKAIEKATILDISVIAGIMSKYALGGMTRSVLWREAVEHEIFLRSLIKLRELIEFWDKPMAENFDLVNK